MGKQIELLEKCTIKIIKNQKSDYGQFTS